MNYDVAHRYAQALDPSALTTLPGAVHGLEAAIADCRRAGKSAEPDPAVLLLARHLGGIAGSQGGADSALRHACHEALGELRRKPLLLTLAARGVGYDDAAMKAFHGEARRALKALGDALGYDHRDYELRSSHGGIAVSGEVILHSREVYVMVSCGGFGGDVMFRRCRDRRDYTGGQNHRATLAELLAPASFAARICRALQLEVPETGDLMVA